MATATVSTRRRALGELRALAASGAALAESFDVGEVGVVEALPAWKAADRLERAAAALKTVLAAKVEEAHDVARDLGCAAAR